MAPVFEKRPSGDTLAGLAWRSTFAAMRRMPVLMLSVLAASVLFRGLGLYLEQIGMLPFSPQNPIPSLVCSLMLIVLRSLIATPLAVAMHRFVLLDEVTAGPPSLAAAHTRIFFLWAVSLQLLYFLVAQISLLAKGSAFLSALAVVVLFTLWILSAFLAMIFPAIATNVPSAGPADRIVTSARRMKGHFWLFVRALIIAYLPVLVPTVVALLSLEWLQIEFADSIRRSGFALIGAVAAAPTIALAAAVVSWTYASLRRE